MNSPDERIVHVTAGEVSFEGNLGVPPHATGVVLFAHGSGSSRHSSRNRYVAGVLRDAGLGTLLIDLLTAEEESADLRTRHLRFDIEMLAQRLAYVTDWLDDRAETRGLKVGLFGASTGGGAALIAATQRPERIGAVVSRGGRPDLARDYLPRVLAPTLLLVGGDDLPVIEMNREAYELLRATKEMTLIPGATHLFEEPGTLEDVARLSADWFTRHLAIGHPGAQPV